MEVQLLRYMCEIWAIQCQQFEEAATPPEPRRLSTVAPLIFYTG